VIPWVVAAAVGMGAHAVAASMSFETVALVCKPLPVAILAIGVARTGDRPGSWLLAAALAVDAVADGVIELVFLGGLGLFLVGHVLRIVAFTADVRSLRPMRAIPFIGLAAGASSLVVPTAGALGVPIVLYAFAIATMGWRAAARVDGSVAGWLGLVGAVLFLVSDSLLAVNRFVTPLAAVDLTVMGTYWAAQVAIACSARTTDLRVSSHGAAVDRG
jgi:alkenylglycerophosphocholine hydrolase